MALRPLALIFALVSMALQLGAAEATDPLRALPALPKPLPGVAAATQPGEMVRDFAPGVQVVLGKRVILTGSVIMDQGPVDGLEVLACLASGKTHEAIVRLAAPDGHTARAAFTAALGLEKEGVPAPESSGLPARGWPLSVTLEWADPDHPGASLAVAASSLVRDRSLDRSFPALPFIYTGSRFLTLDETGLDGKPVRHERFMLDSTKSIVVIFDEADALLASPFPDSGSDKHFEVNSGICPPAQTPVRLVFAPVELPLTLVQALDGSLSAGGKTLGDAELEALLAERYGAAATPSQRAVAVRVDPASERAVDVATRRRLLILAASAKAWVVPVFVLP
ncbi:MAG: hypothetical protein H0X38_05480 [Planctomycetes bacterium]|nr:hypothetical protein [Planctomycetota bacterium]